MDDKKPEFYRDEGGDRTDMIMQAPGMIFKEMQLLNVVVILMITVLTVHAQRGYIHDRTALNFLMEAGSIPTQFWKLPV